MNSTDHDEARTQAIALLDDLTGGSMHCTSTDFVDSILSAVVTHPDVATKEWLKPKPLTIGNPPACPTCGTRMELREWERPGGAPGNGYGCPKCSPMAKAEQWQPTKPAEAEQATTEYPERVTVTVYQGRLRAYAEGDRSVLCDGDKNPRRYVRADVAKRHTDEIEVLCMRKIGELERAISSERAEHTKSAEIALEEISKWMKMSVENRAERDEARRKLEEADSKITSLERLLYEERNKNVANEDAIRAERDTARREARSAKAAGIREAAKHLREHIRPHTPPAPPEFRRASERAAISAAYQIETALLTGFANSIESMAEDAEREEKGTTP